MRQSPLTCRSTPRVPGSFGVFSIALLTISVSSGCGRISWGMDYERALRTASEQRTRVLVAFHSMANADCRAMDTEAFSDAAVQKHIREYVPVRLDPIINWQLARKFGVDTVPAFFVVRPDGEVMGSRVGKMTAEQFDYFLIRNRLN